MKTITAYEFKRKDCTTVVLTENYRIPVVWQMVYAHRLIYGEQSSKVTFVEFARDLIDINLNEAVTLVSDAFEAAEDKRLRNDQ